MACQRRRPKTAARHRHAKQEQNNQLYVWKSIMNANQLLLHLLWLEDTLSTSHKLQQAPITWPPTTTVPAQGTDNIFTQVRRFANIYFQLWIVLKWATNSPHIHVFAECSRRQVRMWRSPPTWANVISSITATLSTRSVRRVAKEFFQIPNKKQMAWFWSILNTARTTRKSTLSYWPRFVMAARIWTCSAWRFARIWYYKNNRCVIGPTSSPFSPAFSNSESENRKGGGLALS